MSRFAPVGPLSVMWPLLSAGCEAIGNYHLLLAHDVLANPNSWRDWSNALRNMRWHLEGGKIQHPTIIMDSSVIELGKPMPMSKILQAAKIVNADVIVLPDVIGDQATTHALCYDFELAWRGDSSELRKYEYMFVPQGRDLAEYIDSLTFMETHMDCVRWVGLPRDCHEHGIKSRRDLINIVNGFESRKGPYKIHLLGMSNHDLIDDVISCHHADNVVGIDSAVPLRAGWLYQEFKLTRTDYGKRGNFWKEAQLNTKILDNISYVRRTFK